MANFICAIVNFGIKQEPLGYNIVCNIISLTSLIVSLCKLVYTLQRYCKCTCITNRIKPSSNTEPVPSQDNKSEQPSENESDPDAIGAQLWIQYFKWVSPVSSNHL